MVRRVRTLPVFHTFSNPFLSMNFGIDFSLVFPPHPAGCRACLDLSVSNPVTPFPPYPPRRSQNRCSNFPGSPPATSKIASIFGIVFWTLLFPICVDFGHILAPILVPFWLNFPTFLHHLFEP